MGCLGTRSGLRDCKSWKELNEAAEALDNKIKEEKLTIEKTKAEKLSGEEIEAKNFLYSFIAWDRNRVNGKKFDSHICKLADDYYDTLHSKLKEDQEKMKTAYDSLNSHLNLLKNEEIQKSELAVNEAPKSPKK